MADAVDHPEHYNAHPKGIECIDVVEDMTFNVGNAIKYLWRAGLKGDVIEDLKKARWYIEREIQRCDARRRPAAAVSISASSSTYGDAPGG